MTVVVFHFGHGVFPFDVAPIDRLVFTEAIAVSYFFVLSGFIMAVVHYRPGGRVDTLEYWNARFARIYPVYALALALPLIDAMRAGGIDVKATLATASLLQAWLPPYPLALNAPAWSLSVEAFFYLLFPFFVVAASAWSDRRLIASTALLWLATQALHVYLLNRWYGGYPSRSHDFIFYNPLLHLSTFAVGAAAGMLVVRHRARLRDAAATAGPVWILATAAIALALVLEGALSSAIGLRVTFNNGALAPLFALLIVALALDESAAARALAHPWLLLLGEASYAVYLLQIPFATIYERALAHAPPLAPSWRFYVYALLLVAVSVAVFWGVERPLRARIRRWYATRAAVGLPKAQPQPPR